MNIIMSSYISAEISKIKILQINENSTIKHYAIIRLDNHLKFSFRCHNKLICGYHCSDTFVGNISGVYNENASVDI